MLAALLLPASLVGRQDVLPTASDVLAPAPSCLEGAKPRVGGPLLAGSARDR